MSNFYLVCNHDDYVGITDSIGLCRAVASRQSKKDFYVVAFATFVEAIEHHRELLADGGVEDLSLISADFEETREDVFDRFCKKDMNNFENGLVEIPQVLL